VCGNPTLEEGAVTVDERKAGRLAITHRTAKLESDLVERHAASRRPQPADTRAQQGPAPPTLTCLSGRRVLDDDEFAHAGILPR
jgi:hypothetical protein